VDTRWQESVTIWSRCPEQSNHCYTEQYAV